MNDQELANSIVTLYSRGWSIRQLSASLGISRGRVRRILEKNTQNRSTEQLPFSPPRNKGISKLDPFKDYVSELLNEHENITNQRLLEMLQEKGYSGGITILRDYLVGVRVRKPRIQ